MKRITLFIGLLMASTAMLLAVERPDSAFVSIETNPGAEIGINGNMSSTNFMTAKVPIGMNTVTVVLGTQFEKDFICDVQPGVDNKFKFYLDGTLDITAVPSSANIYVDGQHVGKGHASVNQIVGLHNVKVDTDDEKYDAQLFSVNIRPDGRETRNVSLTKLPPPLRIFGHITWAPNDWGVMVGLCSRFGGYVRYATELQSFISPFYGDFSTSPSYYNQLAHYTRNDTRTSYITAGGMACLHDNIYVYLGAGYGARYASYSAYKNYSWYGSLDLGSNGVMVDGGIIARWKNYSMNVGYTRMVTAAGWDKAKFGEIIIGLGVNFKL